ncbi:hypothetical protein BBR01nite_48180 [Brevibacillus brevis]|nr:hypothetical protein BBR01nite_48180 [Brevibacillus brevis]
MLVYTMTCAVIGLHDGFVDVCFLLTPLVYDPLSAKWRENYGKVVE